MAGVIDNDQRLAFLVGVFVARWSLAETCLLYPLMMATGATQEVAAGILSSTNSAEGKIKLVKTAIQQCGIAAEKKSEILGSLKKLEKLCEARNSISHHLWAMTEDGDAATFDHRKPVDDPGRVTLRKKEDIAALCDAVVVAAHHIAKSCDVDFVDSSSVELLSVSGRAVD